MKGISLETPFGGAVVVGFETYTRCLIRLPNHDTEPPAAPLEVNGRAVCGDLVFALKEGVWQWQPHRFNYCEYTDTLKPASPGKRTLLINTLSHYLGLWCKDNPDALEAVYRAVDEHYVVRLQTEIRDLDNQITQLVNAKAERQALVNDMQKLRRYIEARP